MTKAKRLQEIKRLLEANGEVQNADLAQLFHVSEMTVRRDIDLLSQDAAIIRVRGGAYLASIAQQREPSYIIRSQEASDVKDKIAVRAVEIMQDATNVYLDSGTTTERILRHVNNKSRHIITNGINIAQESVNYSHISTVLIGGDFRANSLSTAGITAEEQIKRYRFDVAFIGANAIDNCGNIYVGTTLEVGLKRCVINNSVRCYVLADSSKFNSYSLTSYGNLTAVTGVITDRGISAEALEQLEAVGVNVIIADQEN